MNRQASIILALSISLAGAVAWAVYERSLRLSAKEGAPPVRRSAPLVQRSPAEIEKLTDEMDLRVEKAGQTAWYVKKHGAYIEKQRKEVAGMHEAMLNNGQKKARIARASNESKLAAGQISRSDHELEEARIKKELEAEEKKARDQTETYRKALEADSAKLAPDLEAAILAAQTAIEAVVSASGDPLDEVSAKAGAARARLRAALEKAEAAE